MGGELARHADLGAAGSYLLAAWDEERGIWLSSSRDAGESWDEPRRLSTQDAVASHPIVVHARDGFVVFWTERSAGRRFDWQSHRLAHASSDEG